MNNKPSQKQQKIIEFSEPKTKELALIKPTGYGGFTNKDISILRTTAFKDCATMDELAMACCLAKKYELDPFAKEIWAIRLSQGLVIEASASGWRKIIRRQPNFKRMVINAWYKGDEIEFDLINGKVLKHKSCGDTSGDPVGAYCFVEYKDGTSNLDFALWSEYGKPAKEKNKYGKEYDTPWKYKREMIKNKAAAIFGRTYCGVSGLYAEGEVEDNFVDNNENLSLEEKKERLRKKLKTDKTNPVNDLP